MLAQSFKSAADLELTEEQKEALIKVLVLLETGKLKHVNTGSKVSRSQNHFFDMEAWIITYEGCGTAGCIGGTAELLAGKPIFGNNNYSDELHNLFYYPLRRYQNITVEQAARALRSYLTTGNACWDDVLEGRY